MSFIIINEGGKKLHIATTSQKKKSTTLLAFPNISIDIKKSSNYNLYTLLSTQERKDKASQDTKLMFK